MPRPYDRPVSIGGVAGTAANTLANLLAAPGSAGGNYNSPPAGVNPQGAQAPFNAGGGVAAGTQSASGFAGTMSGTGGTYMGGQDPPNASDRNGAGGTGRNL